MGSLEVNANVVGMRLPNGKIQVVQSSNPSEKGRIFESDSDFYKTYPNISESSGNISTLLLDSINE